MGYLEVKDKIKVSLLIMLLVIAAIFFRNISKLYLNAESYLIEAGFFRGALVFSALMIISILITPIPSSPFAVIAGAVFRPFPGLLITLVSATIGAVLAFLIGRYFLHDFFYRKFKKNRIYRRMLEDEKNNVLRFIFVSRLMPQLPFDIISYFSGITNIKVWEFALVTFLGMIPIVFLLTFFGHVFESYRIFLLAILFSFSILYAIYKILRYKRYYVRGY